MRAAIVARLQSAAAPDVAARAQRLIKIPGNIAEQLLALGFSSKDVLAACSAVTAVALAPKGWSARAVFLDAVEDRALCIQLGAAPFSLGPGRLGIAYADPIVATSSVDLGFPLHTPFLAPSTEVEEVLARSPSGVVTTTADAVGEMTVDDMKLPASAMSAMASLAAKPPVVDEDSATVDERKGPARRPAPPSFELPSFEPPKDDDSTLQLDPGPPPSSELHGAPTNIFDAAGFEARDVTAPQPSLPSLASAPPAQKNWSELPAPAPAPTPSTSTRNFLGPLDPELPPSGSRPRPARPARAPTTQTKLPQAPASQEPAPLPSRPLPRAALAVGIVVVVAGVIVGGFLVITSLLREEKKAPRPERVAVVDAAGNVDANARQASMTATALAEPDAQKSIALLTRAIEVDPLSAAARPALLARARLHQQRGDLERARRDLQRIEAKGDDKERAVVAALLADIEKKIAVERLTTPTTPPAPPTDPATPPDPATPTPPSSP